MEREENGEGGKGRERGLETAVFAVAAANDDGYSQLLLHLSGNCSTCYATLSHRIRDRRWHPSHSFVVLPDYYPIPLAQLIVRKSNVVGPWSSRSRMGLGHFSHIASSSLIDCCIGA